MKKYLIIALTLIAVTSFGSSFITWSTDPALDIGIGNNQGVVYFDGTPALKGGLVQLIYLGGNGTWDGLKVSDAGTGLGVQGDDEVVDFNAIGAGFMASNGDGHFAIGNSPITNAIGSYFAVIAFKDASSGSGFIPADPSVYGIATTGHVVGATTFDGSLVTTAGDPAIQSDTFSFAIVMVPEPASMALGLLGLGILVARRIRK